MAAFPDQIIDGSTGIFDLAQVDAAQVALGYPAQWIMGNGKAENAFKRKLREAGGVTTVELNGVYFTAYDGVPFIRNDYIGMTGDTTDIYVGSWDDGSSTGGLVALTTFGDLFHYTEIPATTTHDATLVRVVLYGAATVFSPKAVAVIKGVDVVATVPPVIP
jgi:hypothetical protein